MLPPYVNDKTLRYLMDEKRRQAGALPDQPTVPAKAFTLRQRLFRRLGTRRRPRATARQRARGERVMVVRKTNA